MLRYYKMRLLSVRWGTDKLKGMDCMMSERIDHRAVVDVVLEAGELLAAQFGKLDAFMMKSEAPVDVVTTLDLSVEQMLAERLYAAYPEIGFVGEEFGVTRAAERFWLVDPIDGTAHFIRGTPFCTTMVALIDNNEVVFSLIYDFVRKDLYMAEKGHGASLNGSPLQVSNRPFKKSYLSVEANVEHHPEDLARFLELRRSSVMIETVNCGYEFGLIATGKIEGRICMHPYGRDYDYAAGTLLVAEAGGIVANIGQTTYDYRNHDFLATNKVVYEELTSGPDALFPLLDVAELDHRYH
jgi:myo-inositol-1(or 4)-monophosphatase